MLPGRAPGTRSLGAPAVGSRKGSVESRRFCLEGFRAAPAAPQRETECVLSRHSAACWPDCVGCEFIHSCHSVTGESEAAQKAARRADAASKPGVSQKVEPDQDK